MKPKKANKPKKTNPLLEQIEAEIQKLKTPKVPTAIELANLSAALTSRLATNKDEAINQGLEFFEACQKKIDRKQEFHAKLHRGRLADLEGQKRLVESGAPEAFPVPFKKFLRLICGGKSYGDRLKKFRDYIRDNLTRTRRADGTYSEEEMMAETEKCVTGYQTEPIHEVRYMNLLTEFRAWESRRISEKNSANRRKVIDTDRD